MHQQNLYMVFYYNIKERIAFRTFTGSEENCIEDIWTVFSTFWCRAGILCGSEVQSTVDTAVTIITRERKFELDLPSRKHHCRTIKTNCRDTETKNNCSVQFFPLGPAVQAELARACCSLQYITARSDPVGQKLWRLVDYYKLVPNTCVSSDSFSPSI